MRHHLQFLRVVFVAIVLFSFAAVASAQEITGSIVGTVKDANGASVSGATVTIADTDKKVVVRTVTTDDDGQFSVPNLQAGTYDLTVEAPNFKKHIESKVKVDVGQRRPVDVALAVGNISEVVTVEANPLTVELSTPTASTVVNGDQARELSINNRNFIQLVTLAPGVTNDLADQVYVGTTNPAGQANTVNISVNGARSSQNTFTVDGSDITDRGSNITIQTYPSIDSIGEFKVLRSLYPAESGSSGGGQVNIITRSGGEKFHGSVFEFVRNDKLNANDFLTNSTASPAFGREANGKARRGPFRYNNYGFTFGGPIYVPRFGEGGKAATRLARTFFFFSEEKRIDHRFTTPFTTTVPDLNLRQGIFPIPVCINRNDNGSTCTGANILPAGTPLPAGSLNNAAAAYVSQIYNKLPVPNAGTAANPYILIAAAQNLSDFRQEILRIDHTFTSRLSAFWKYEHDKIPTLDGNSLFSSGTGLPGVSTTLTDSPGNAQTFQMTYAMSSRTIIEGRFTHSYGAILSHNIGSLALANTQVPINLPFTNTRDRVPSVTGNGFSGLTSFGPYNNFSNKNVLAGSVTQIYGSHTLKFGGDFAKYRKNENALIGDATGANNGIYSSFSNALPAGVTASTLNQSLQQWANFLVGNAVTFVQGQFDYTADMRQNVYEVYGQDEFRFRKNLTVYYGLRWSRFDQPYDNNGRLSNFDPALFTSASAPQVTGAGNRVAGTGNFCDGMFVNSQNLQTLPSCTPTISPFGKKIASTPNRDFAPRVGLAWDPFGKGTTSVRMGYGIYYDQVLVGYAEQIIGQNPPYQLNVTASNVRIDNPGAGTLPAAPQTIRAIQSNWKDPYMQHWSLDIQHQFKRNMVVSVGYYGSKGTHLIGITEIDEVPPGLALNTLCAPGNNNFQTAGVVLVRCQPAGYAFRNSSSASLTLNPQPGFIDDRILDQIRPFRGYRSITMLQPRYNSNYHSLQVAAQKRFSGASQIGLAYTWSKNLTDDQTDRSTAPENSYSTQTEYGRAQFDRRHVLTVNYVYELPFFRGKKGAEEALLGGWQVSGITTFQTGLPFTATTSSFDAAGLGNNPALVAGNRPNMLCDPNAGAPHTQQQYFNTACFQLNPALAANFGLVNTPGNAPRGGINGPPTKRFDVSLMKNIRFGEGRYAFQLRGEFFNVFNHTNFRSFSSTNVTSTLFGVIGAVRDPRTIQFGAKFSF
jgi:Carboxypeptidase regulatory-like domain